MSTLITFKVNVSDTCGLKITDIGQLMIKRSSSDEAIFPLYYADERKQYGMDPEYHIRTVQVSGDRMAVWEAY